LGKESGRPASGAYLKTHGEVVSSAVAPYVEDYASANKIDLAAVLKALLPQPAQPGPEIFVISSGSYITGDWTYFISSNTRVYELLQVSAPSPCYLVLYSASSPSAAGEWSLALLNADYRIIARTAFRAVPADASEVDSITTRLESKQTIVEAVITYAHAGGGGSREKQFRVTIPFSAKSRRFLLPTVRKLGR